MLVVRGNSEKAQPDLRLREEEAARQHRKS